MSQLQTRISKRTFGEFVVHPGVTFNVQSLSRQAFGGPELAKIQATGPRDELWELIELLRCPVEIYTPERDPLWWGYVESVDLRVGAIQISVTLEGMANRICVTYSLVNGAGTVGERATTDWVQDDDSIAEFGTVEARFSLNQGSSEQATAQAESYLSRLGRPRRKPPTFEKQDEISATLNCAGWWKTLSWKYFANNDGKESYEESGTGLMPIGKGTTATTISFETGTTQKIKSTDKLMLDFSANEVIFISGSSANNGAFTISSVRDVENGGSYAIVDEAVVNEGAGAAITIRGATKCAESFQITSANGWLADTVRIRMKKEGNPADTVVVSLYTALDGTLLASGSIQGADISENLNWVEAKLTPRVMLTQGTTYWIVIERSGVILTQDYYKVDTNEDIGYGNGVMKINDGAAWIDRVPDADMLFQVNGVEETTAQIARILTSCGQFITGTDFEVASGVYSTPYRDGDSTAKDCIEELLTSGTANKRRMLATVDANRRIRIYEEPVSDNRDYLIRDDGHMDTWMSLPLEDFDIPAGVWARLRDIIPATADTSKLADLSRMFLEGVEYDIEMKQPNYIERDMQRMSDITAR